MKRPIVILDTVGVAHEAFHPKYLELFPQHRFHHVRPDRKRSYGPHGGQCAFCYLSQLPEHTDGRDIYFIKILDDNYDFIRDHWWMDALRDIRPGLINFSVGAHHRNDSELTRWFYLNWRGFADKFSQLLEDTDSQLFAASGNDDSSSINNLDLDNDVAFPQRLMSNSNRVHIIGACDQAGVPAGFSSDGREVLGMYWGHRVPVMNPFTAEWQMISGTSFASPFAMGDCDARNLDKSPHHYLSHVIDNSRSPVGWNNNIRHPKAGYGGMLSSMRGNFKHTGQQKDLINKLQYPRFTEMSISWFDTRRVCPGENKHIKLME